VSLANFFLLIVAGFIAGGINAIAGGGSLISFPALLAAGYSAKVANVTNTIALVPGYVGGTAGYRRELDGQRRRIETLGLVSVLGGLGGAALLLLTPQSLFRAVVPWLILAACALLAAQPWVTRLVRGKQGQREPPRTVLMSCQFVAAIYGGYFGAGLGVIMLALLGIFLNDSLQRLNALKGVLSFSVNVVAAAVFVVFGPVAWLPVLIMAAASLLGGNAGARVARKLQPNILRVAVIAYGVAIGLRLLAG
jgi:uncharacterized membrane protein YfcA